MENITNNLRFRKARYADLPALMQLVGDAQQSLAQLGIDQWQDGYPAKDIVRNDISQKCCYIIEDEENIIAMATLIFNDEPSYNVIEGSWLTQNEFGVVHRMVVDSRYKHQGIALQLLQQFEKRCRRNQIYSLKIDTHEGNLPMLKLLEKAQYSYCGTIWLYSGKKRKAYEKVLVTIINYQSYINHIVGKLHLYATVDDSALLAIGFKPKKYPIIQEQETPLLNEVKHQLEEYFSGERNYFQLPLQPTGTPFQQQVWQALQTIPYGETRSYGQIAAQIGHAAAQRAVGLANNSNPIPIIIPCHRVIGSTGKLVGYAGGLTMKKKLLKIENKIH
jgi:methylated-DNA-[protein]-cysteine S-methyltransferase